MNGHHPKKLFSYCSLSILQIRGQSNSTVVARCNTRLARGCPGETWVRSWHPIWSLEPGVISQRTARSNPWTSLGIAQKQKQQQQKRKFYRLFWAFFCLKWIVTPGCAPFLLLVLCLVFSWQGELGYIQYQGSICGSLYTMQETYALYYFFSSWNVKDFMPFISL